MRIKKSIALLRTALCVSAIALPARAEPPKLPMLPSGSANVALPTSNTASVQPVVSQSTIGGSRVAKLIGLRRKSSANTLHSRDQLSSKIPSAHSDWLDVALQAKKGTLQTAAAHSVAPRISSEPARITELPLPAAAALANSTSMQAESRTKPPSSSLVAVGATAEPALRPASAVSEPIANVETPPNNGTELAQQEDESLLSIDLAEFPPLSTSDGESPNDSEHIDNDQPTSEPARLQIASIGASSGAPKPLLQVQVGSVVATAESCRLTDGDPNSPIVQLANPMKVSTDAATERDSMYRLSDTSSRIGKDNHRLSDLDTSSLNTQEDLGSTSLIDAMPMEQSPLTAQSLNVQETQDFISEPTLLSSGHPSASTRGMAAQQALPSDEKSASSKTAEDASLAEESAPANESNPPVSESLLSIAATPLVHAETATPDLDIILPQDREALVREAVPTHPVTHVLRDTPATETPFSGLIAHTTANTARHDIEIPTRSSKSIELAGPVTDFAVENTSLCKVMKTNTNSLSLIGLRGGQTRLLVKYDDAEGNSCSAVYLLNIANATSASANDLELAVELTKTIKALYPASKVEIAIDRNNLVVRGTATSEDDAQSILNLVRRTTLRPVVDRLLTRR